MALTEQDFKQIASHRISEQQIEVQLNHFAKGFPFLHLEAAAAVGNGIIAPSNEAQANYIKLWEEYKKQSHKIVKFVPASGAASRMFKDLFAFLSASYEIGRAHV